MGHGRGARIVVLVLVCGVADSSRVRGDEDDGDDTGAEEPLSAVYRRFEHVETLTGTVTVNMVSPNRRVDAERTAGGSSSATFQLDLKRVDLSPSAAEYAGTITGSASISHQQVMTTRYENTSTTAGSGTFAPGTIEGNVILSFEDNKLTINIEGTGLPATRTDKCKLVSWRAEGDPPCVTTTAQIEFGATASVSAPLDLNGSVETTDGRSTTTTTWSFQSQREDIELLVEPQGYDAWLPAGTLDQGTSGPRPLAVVARLQKRGGGDPPRKASVIRFHLHDVSTLPGVCNNFPPKAASSTSPDLAFEAAENSGFLIALGPLAETQHGPQVTATATISAFDFGAYGELEVVATLEGGGTIVGNLAGGVPSRIALPKRKPGSKIADKWLADEHASDKPDDWDEEQVPPADPALGGHDGDTLSVFEEYRGFAVNGRHLRGKALVKEMFIVDNVKGEVKAGIALFRHLTGLVIYDELSTRPPLEADPRQVGSTMEGYVVNFNSGRDGDDHVDKQAIGIFALCAAATPPGYRGDYAVPADCNPLAASHGYGMMGDTRSVSLTLSATQNTWYDIRVGRGRISTNYTASTVAHELGHTASIDHHGEGDRDVVSWRRSGDAWTETTRKQGTATVHVENANGQPVAADIIGFDEIWVGVQGGQYSGMEDCIMRYDVASAIEPPGRPGVRVRRPDVREMSGVALCTSKRGTGVNAGPNARYGDASTGGNCKAQMCVNDRIGHP